GLSAVVAQITPADVAIARAAGSVGRASRTEAAWDLAMRETWISVFLMQKPQIARKPPVERSVWRVPKLAPEGSCRRCLARTRPLAQFRCHSPVGCQKFRCRMPKI